LRPLAQAVHARAAVTEFQEVSEAIALATRQPAFRMTLLSWFAAVTLLLAAIGVYGLVSQAVNQRVREIAIRLAIGAKPASVIGEVTRRAAVIGATGLAIGAAAAFLLGNTLQALLFGVQPRDALSFLAAGVALLTTTALAAVVPALRITRVDPARALRAD
jgi:putative ABC transport system permease protein